MEDTAPKAVATHLLGVTNWEPLEASLQEPLVARALFQSRFSPLHHRFTNMDPDHSMIGENGASLDRWKTFRLQIFQKRLLPKEKLLYLLSVLSSNQRSGGLTVVSFPSHRRCSVIYEHFRKGKKAIMHVSTRIPPRLTLFPFLKTSADWRICPKKYLRAICTSFKKHDISIFHVKNDSFHF